MIRRLMVSVVGVVVLITPLRGQDAASLSQILPALKPRCIGPANMSGRIVDVAVYEKEPRIQYIASASGGLWKTVNHGTTFKPVFERASSIALGAVAVFQGNPDVVWVGTGEGNPRNSVSWGDGVYRSTDGGKSWHHTGLQDTHHIGRIVTHPTDPDIAYVAALGKLWGPNPQRGLFKTADGGKTWSHVLAVGDNTGCVDVAIDPQDPDLLYAAAYHVRRDTFAGGNPAVQVGPGGGLYKTTDGGKSWAPMLTGLPAGPFGRCGLSVCRSRPNIVYAVVQTAKTSVTTQGQGSNNPKLGPDAGGIFRSDDKGKSWTYVNSLCPRPFYYGQIRVDPSDDQRVTVLGIAYHVSSDGGKSFNEANAAKGTHSDYHALWIDPRDPQHLVLGCDGGLNYSFDRGHTWEHLKNLPVSQFYAVGVDMRTPYRVYGGLQDNGTWGGPSATRDSAGITIAEWINILGYDGYYCQVDPADVDTVFCEGQYGILRRINVRIGAVYDIKPRLASKEGKTNIIPDPGKHPEFRFNWSSPILLSPHNGKTVWYGGNHLFRSTDRGDSWAIVSRDLTRGKPGANDFKGHTITTIAESPRRAGLLYVGTDDGMIWRTDDGARSWHDLSATVPAMPRDRWITRVECSPHDEGTVFMGIDRHRHDDASPYLFRSIDHGRSWTPLSAGLPPNGPVHVVRADPVNKDLLYAGTEFGLFVSLDAGKSWQKQSLLPTVPVHDLVVHPRDAELVVATHGRGIFIMDVKPLQEANAELLSGPAHLFTIRPVVAYRSRTLHTLGIKSYSGENPPYGASIYLYLRQMPAAPPPVTIADGSGRKVAELKAAMRAGVQHLSWRLGAPDAPKDVFRAVPPGTYTVTVRIGERTVQRAFDVAADE